MRDIAVCLLSGGIDSCVASTLTKKNNEIYLLSFDYGQTLVKELEHAKRIGNYLKPKEHKILSIRDFKEVSWSALTGQKEIPKNWTLEKSLENIPDNYPPARDPFFIMLASAWLESIMLKDTYTVNVGKIVIGTIKEDSLVFPDCKKEFYKRYNNLFKISTKVAIQYHKPFKIETPLIDLTKREVIKIGLEIDAPLQFTWSCYKGEELACGECDPCKFRKQAFEENGIKDFVRYRS